MKKLSIDWNESYEVNPEYPQGDIAILIDKTLEKSGLKGFQAKNKKMGSLSFSQKAKVFQ